MNMAHSMGLIRCTGLIAEQRAQSEKVPRRRPAAVTQRQIFNQFRAIAVRLGARQTEGVMLTVAISASVVVFIGILALKCVSAVKEARAAHEELEERIRLLKEVASGEETVRGRRALAEARPMRRILDEAEDDLPAVGTGPA
jgi:hypothetical protein